jgi:hypothetical protein
MAVVAAVGAAVAITGAVVSANQADKAAGRARRNKNKAEAELESIKASRQAITNPYIGTEDLSGLATNLTGMVSNPFASLGVATSAAEIKIEEADIALANTLDTLRATGASAGGATALAQAALQSKKGVASSIEQQEAQNEQMKARGEQQLQQMKMSEQQRMQNIAISEGQRVQQADAAGKTFMFDAQENRTNMDLNRAAGKITQQTQLEADAMASKNAAIAGGFQAVGSIGGAMIGGGITSSNNWGRG